MTLSELWQPLRRLLAHHLARLRDNVEVMGDSTFRNGTVLSF